MTADAVLRRLAGATDVLDVLELLLAWAEDRFRDDDWMAFRATHLGALDAVGAQAEAALADRCVPLPDAAPAVGALADVWRANPDDDVATLVVASARAIDRAFGNALDAAWVRRVTDRGTIGPGDLVVLAGSDPVAALLAGRSVAVPFTRADERPDRTRRTLLFRPSPSAPALTTTPTFGAALDAVLVDGTRFATCHPVAGDEPWGLDFPARPPRAAAAGFPARCGRLLAAAHGAGATVVVFPELVGYDAVTDELRRAGPGGPLLVVAGSGHLGVPPRRRNESLMWMVTADGTATPARRVLKRVPYVGAAGAEELDVRAGSVEIIVSERWRVAVAICRDGIQSATIDALRDAGVNLLLVPAWTPKTTNLGGDAGRVANTVPGFSVVANGVAAARDGRTGALTPVPLALFGAPVDRGPRQHDVEGEPPCVVVYDPGRNATTVAAVH